MKSIAQFVAEGIREPGDLVAALRTAMRLEFSTLPPYLCAEWSIKGDPDSDPDSVGRMIRSISIQEMYHFALAGNILAAIGHIPRFADPGFLVSYPTNDLPGDVHQTLSVDLKPLSLRQLDVFMQIENPQFDPVDIKTQELVAAEPPATIGDFYDTLIGALQRQNPSIDANAKFVVIGEAGPIGSVSDAVAAINRIKDEGEGSPKSPSQGPSDQAKLAHFYTFQMIRKGVKYVYSNGKWSIDPKATTRLPMTFDYAPGKAGSADDFSRKLTMLLKSLEASWTTGGAPDTALMDELAVSGKALIRGGIRPEFVWLE